MIVKAIAANCFKWANASYESLIVRRLKCDAKQFLKWIEVEMIQWWTWIVPVINLTSHICGLVILVREVVNVIALVSRNGGDGNRVKIIVIILSD